MIINNSDHYNMNVYSYLSMVQSIYSRFLQIRTQLAMLDDNVKILTNDFYASPTNPKLDAVQNAWNQKYILMRQIPQVVSDIISNLIEATKFALFSMQTSIDADNKLSIILNDNAIASIYSLIEQDSHQLNIKELYRQNCIAQNIPIQLSDIEMRSQMMRLSIPNFDHLKTIIRGY